MSRNSEAHGAQLSAPAKTIPPLTAVGLGKKMSEKQESFISSEKESHAKGILLNFMISKLLTSSTENLTLLRGRRMTI